MSSKALKLRGHIHVSKAPVASRVTETVSLAELPPKRRGGKERKPADSPGVDFFWWLVITGLVLVGIASNLFLR